MFLIYTFSLITSFLTILPLSTSKYWMVRAFDFPRIQFLIVNTTLLLILIFFKDERVLFNFSLASIILSIGLDIYRIAPYTPLFKMDVKTLNKEINNIHIKILCLNILIDNKDYNMTLSMIHETDPDLVLLLETDQNWSVACSILKEKYRYQILQPQENGYGILLYSKHELLDPEIKFLTDARIPSVFFNITIDNVNINFIALHPSPPGLIKSTSKQRDNELLEASLWIKSNPKTPVVVFGDFNDVAWSHSTRKFLRDTNLKDPRRGRGFYSTFPASKKLFFMRYPLDQIFLSKEFTLSTIKVFNSVNSDHLPIFAEISINRRT